MSRPRESTDFLIIGGGVVGLTVALELRRRQPKASITILEKERRCGAHASGRNSGVLHAGFYYSGDSLKARLCRDGQRRMIDWCAAEGVHVRHCGKLVVASHEDQLGALDELGRRASAAGVTWHDVDEQEARRLEPRARTVGRALYSPNSAAVDPDHVMQALVRRARLERIDIHTGRAWHPTLNVTAGYTINAAGLYADRIAHAFGMGRRYAIVPFKGLYLMARADAPALGMHIYPVPDLDMPFLGVHLSITAGGRTKIGPTAFPAPWREAYGSLATFDRRELMAVLADGIRMATNASFRRHAIREIPKLTRRAIVRRAQALVPSTAPEHFEGWGRPGIRAQLMNRKTGELVMDFCYEADERSLHVLNAVSPAFTSAFAFAALVTDTIEKRIR